MFFTKRWFPKQTFLILSDFEEQEFVFDEKSIFNPARKNFP